VIFSRPPPSRWVSPHIRLPSLGAPACLRPQLLAGGLRLRLALQLSSSVCPAFPGLAGERFTSALRAQFPRGPASTSVLTGCARSTVSGGCCSGVGGVGGSCCRCRGRLRDKVGRMARLFARLALARASLHLRQGLVPGQPLQKPWCQAPPSNTAVPPVTVALASRRASSYPHPPPCFLDEGGGWGVDGCPWVPYHPIPSPYARA
jgi:hypothetical protein